MLFFVIYTVPTFLSLIGLSLTKKVQSNWIFVSQNTLKHDLWSLIFFPGEDPQTLFSGVNIFWKFPPPPKTLFRIRPCGLVYNLSKFQMLETISSNRNRLKWPTKQGD